MSWPAGNRLSTVNADWPIGLDDHGFGRLWLMTTRKRGARSSAAMRGNLQPKTSRGTADYYVLVQPEESLALLLVVRQRARPCRRELLAVL